MMMNYLKAPMYVILGVMLVWVFAVGRPECLAYGVVVSESVSVLSHKPYKQHFESNVRIDENTVVKVASKRRLAEGQSITLKKRFSFIGLKHTYIYEY